MPLEVDVIGNERQIFAPTGEFIVGRNQKLRPDKEGASAGEVIGAAFARENILAPLFTSDPFAHDETVNDPDFDALELENPDAPWDGETNPFVYLRGFENDISSFADARSHGEVQNIKRKILRERDNTRILSEAGAGGIAASMVAGVLDPLILIPGTSIVKGAKGIKVMASARRGALIAGSAIATQEAILQGTQETRTIQESAINIGAGTVLGSILGTGAAFLGKARYNRVKRKVQNFLDDLDTFDSAHPAGSVEEARAILSQVDAPKAQPAFGFERFAAWVNQRVRPYLSDNPIARKMANLLHRPGVKVEGRRAFDAETFADIQRARTELAVEFVEQMFLEAAQGSGKNLRQKVFGINSGPRIDGIGNVDDFWLEVARRLRGAETTSELVENAAKVLRENITDPILRRAIDLDMLDKALLKEQDRYLSAFWDPERLRDPASRAELMERLVEDGRRHFDETQGKLDLDEFGERTRVFDEAGFRDRMTQFMDSRTQMSLARNIPDLAARGNKTRGIFMDRVLDFIDDYNRYEKWLVNDPRVILRRYSRAGWSEIALAERYGLVTVRGQISQIGDEFLPRIRAAQDQTAANEVVREMNGRISGLVDESNVLRESLENGAFDRGARVTDRDSELAKLLFEADTDDAARGILRQQHTNLIRHFSAGDLELALDQVATRFAQMEPPGTASAAKQRKFARDRDRTMQSLRNARDFVRGTLDIPADPTAVLPRALLGARKAVHTMLGGSIGLSSIPDLGLLTANIGMRRTFGTAFDVYVRNLNRLAIRKKDAELLLGPSLIINDSITQSRMAMGLEDMAHTSAPTVAGRGIENLVRFTNFTSLATPWNQTIRDMIVFTTQSFIDDVGARLAAGKRVSKGDLARLQELGLDEPLLRRIGQQFERHAIEVDGVKDPLAPNLAAWDDPVAIQAMQQAIRIADDITLLKGSPLDRPALDWMAPEWKGVIFQFMAFSLSATSRISTRTLQSLRRGEIHMLNGMGLMVGIGALSVYLKSVARGTKRPENPEEWMLAGIQQSGVLGILDQVDGVVTQATKGKVGLSPLFGRNRFYSPDSMLGAVFGPVAGKASELGQVVGGFADLDPEPKDIERARRLMFLQNHWLLSRPMDSVEEALKESVAD